MSARFGAPGKLLLLGEYAVLEGAPALAVPVDRWATVSVKHADGSGSVHAPDLLDSTVAYQLKGDRIVWPDGGNGQLPLVDACLTELAAAGVMAGALQVELSTRDFFDPASGEKLGLGSSAALCVALIRAVLEVNDRDAGPNAVFSHALRAHRAFQGGRGSGVDLAVAAHGALLSYRLINGEARIKTLPWPDGLFAAAIWTRQSASTVGMLEQLSLWRNRQPAAYVELMDALIEQCHAGCSAFAAGRSQAFFNHARACTDLVDALGQAAGIEIVSAPHRRAIEAAEDHDLLYRPSGAGGGDFGVAFSTDPGALIAFQRLVETHGLQPLDVGLPGQGRL